MRTLLPALLLTAALPSAPTAEPCPGTIDQSQDLHGPGSLGTGPDIELAQTFTVGTDGILAEIWHSGIMAIGEGFAFFSVTGTTAEGHPDYTRILGVRTVPLPLPSGFWHVLDYRSFSILPEPGERLALVLRAEVTAPHPEWPVRWTRRDGNPYPDGELMYRVLPDPWTVLPDADTRFRTYMCPVPVPVEPATWGRLKAQHR